MNDITQLSTLYSNAIARAEKAEEERAEQWRQRREAEASLSTEKAMADMYRRQMEPLVEAMKGIDHFKDALNWHQDHLSKALLQWINAGSSALETISPPPPVRETP